ncbi:translation initiation factor IF-3, mitochondrial-like [Argonauta hians]
MALLAGCQRNLFWSLLCPLARLSKARPCTPPVNFHIRLASSVKEPKTYRKNKNDTNKALFVENKEQKPIKLIKLFDEAGILLPIVKKEEAVQLAKLKDLKLVQITEDNYEPHYQLMTGKQLSDCRLLARKSKKDKPPVEKVLQINSNISQHDFTIKLNKVKGFLEKNINVKLKILIPRRLNETESRQAQLKLFKQITEETGTLATVKEVSSKETEMTLILRKKV